MTGFFWQSLAAVIFVFAAAGDAVAENNTATAYDVSLKKKEATIVELFTSQGCSACPPAEAHVRALAADPQVLTFEYHVDYWDKKPGQGWTDHFSRPEWTERQMLYHQSIMKNDRIYTPQIIIDGQYQVIGSDRKAAQEMIRQARVQRGKPITVSPHIIDDRQVLVTIAGGAADRPLSVRLVRFVKHAQTAVTAGENKGRQSEGYNIVTSVQEIGRWDGGRSIHKISMSPLAETEGCAVLLQDPDSLRLWVGRLCGR